MFLTTVNISVALPPLWVALPANVAVTVYDIALTLATVSVFAPLTVNTKLVLLTPFTWPVKVYGLPITNSGALILTTTSVLLIVNVLDTLPGLWVELPANVAVTV